MMPHFSGHFSRTVQVIMREFSWQLTRPIDGIVMDCDGTLSQLEGINVLAEQNGVGEEVVRLTHEAMSLTGVNLNLYRKRMELVRPNLQQVRELGQHYFYDRVPATTDVIDALTALGKPCFILSAGVDPAVTLFGELLGIASDHVHAVELYFDGEGHYRDFDHNSPLTHRGGKRKLVAAIQEQHPRLAYIGDGMNDVSASDMVTRFVGFGGTYYRQRIADHCRFYIKCLSFAPLLALSLTASEAKQLPAAAMRVYQEGVDRIEDGDVLIKL